jgi:predicted XRE-type DNA-binding protein
MRRIAMPRTASKVRQLVREDKQTITPSSGNVFADLGVPEADELLAKADLAHAIQQLIEAQGLSQRAAARRLRITRSDLSNLYSGRLGGFSIARLCRLLTALGLDVRIVVQPKPRSRSPATSVRWSRATDLKPQSHESAHAAGRSRRELGRRRT